MDFSGSLNALVTLLERNWRKKNFIWTIVLLFVDDRLLYLDPHTTQPSIEADIHSQIPDEVSNFFLY